MKKKIMSVVMSIVMLFGCFGIMGCNFDGLRNRGYLPEYESGYYKYAVKTEKDGTKKAYLLGLTELGLEQTVLVYPEEIDGIPVYGIGYERPGLVAADMVGEFVSTNLQKFYFPHMPQEREELFRISFDNAYMVYWNLAEDKRADNRIYGGSNVIFGYNYIESKYWVYDYWVKYIGNVSYLYNYEGNPNEGYYWVDSYNESVITFIPPEPQRDGFTFGGWYKEAECINAWDFLMDITGKEIILDTNKTYNTYDGIYLYAKWIKN